MYDYLDRPLASLSHEERLLVAGMRHWLIAARRGCAPLRAVEPLFREHHAHRALGEFHCLMARLASHATFEIRFCAPRCPAVAEGEALLLTLIGAAKQATPGDLSRRCEACVGQAHGGDFAFALRRLAGALVEAS